MKDRAGRRPARLDLRHEAGGGAVHAPGIPSWSIRMPSSNMGTADRIIRVVLGFVFVALPLILPAFAASPVLLWGAPILGTVLVVTAVIGWCPIYAVLGLSTRPTKPV
jgi:hypothetical protein